MRTLYLSIMVMLLVPAFVIGQQSIDFESLTEGSVFAPPSFSPGDVIGTENGIALVLENFENSDGNLNFLNVQVRNAVDEDFKYGNDNTLFMGGGLKLDFSPVGSTVKSVYFFFKQNGGLIKNLSVNGTMHKGFSFADFPQDWGNGISLHHELFVGGSQGVVRITGDIDELIIGGEGIQIDHLSYNTEESKEIYPGDCNNDGKCNYLDLLNIGVAMNKAGAPRTDNGGVWAAQEGVLWAEAIQPNIAYADVDGNGIINLEDKSLYDSTHLGKTHSGLNTENPTFVEGENTDDFYIYFEKPGGTLGVNDTIFRNINEPFNLDLFLVPGNVTDTIYGLAWIWRFNTLVFGAGNPSFEFDDTDLGTVGNDLIVVLDESRIDQGIIGCAMVRTDGNNVQLTNQIKLGTFNGIIVDLKGIVVSDDNIELDSIRGINSLGEPVPVYDLDNMVYFALITNLEENPFDPSGVIVYPNPTMGNIHLNIKDELLPHVTEIVILNSQGQKIKSVDQIIPQVSISDENLSSGNYFVELKFEKYQSLIYKIQVN